MESDLVMDCSQWSGLYTVESVSLSSSAGRKHTLDLPGRHRDRAGIFWKVLSPEIRYERSIAAGLAILSQEEEKPADDYSVEMVKTRLQKIEKLPR